MQKIRKSLSVILALTMAASMTAMPAGAEYDTATEIIGEESSAELPEVPADGSYTEKDRALVKQAIDDTLKNDYRAWADTTSADCYVLTKWVQDTVFGSAPSKTVTTFSSVSQLREGDIVNLSGERRGSYALVLEIGINYVRMLYGGSSQYYTDMEYTKQDLAERFVKQITRYSDDPEINDDPAYDGFAVVKDYSIPIVGGTAPFCLYKYYGNKEDVVIPEGITYLAKYVFENNNTVRNVTIPSTITAWSSYEFYNCKSLETAVIREGASGSGTYSLAHTFDGCTSLKSVSIPKTITGTFFYFGVFTDCEKLKDIYFSGNINEWDKVVGSCPLPEGCVVHYAQRSVPESITVSAPDKINYKVGEKLDVTGGSVKVTYSGNVTETIPLTSDMCSGFDSSTVGRKPITVTYEGVTAVFTVTVYDKTAPEESGSLCLDLSGNNSESQNYDRWTTPPYSALAVLSDGRLMSVTKDNSDKISVMYFNSEFELADTKRFETELPLYGGFFASSDGYYYLVTGQNNTAGAQDVEDYRVTRYDKNWNELDHASLFGANTTYPFDAGSCDIAEYGNYLVIRTCHEMPNGHQSNVTFQIDKTYMSVVNSFHTVANIAVGYVSHSFNQFILEENGYAVTVDHGDAHPRSVVIGKYTTPINDGIINGWNTKFISTDALSIPGTSGANDTGVSVGGFEYSDSSYLIAINTVDMSGTYNAKGIRNAAVLVVPKSGDGFGTPEMKMLTSYTEGEKGVNTPRLVKTGRNSFVMLWSRNGLVYYTALDGSGKSGKIYSFEGNLSDCDPAVYNGEIVWYVYRDEKTWFYRIKVSDISVNSKTEIITGHNYVYRSTADGVATLTCPKCGRTFTRNVPTSMTVYGRASFETGYYSTGYPKELSVGQYIGFMFGFDPDNTDIAEMEVDVEDENVMKYDPDSRRLTALAAGTTKVTFSVKYNPSVRREVTFTVNSPGSEKTVTSISVTPPAKTEYEIGESLDVTGGYVTVYYSDETSETVPLTSDMCSGFSSTKKGSKTVTVTFKGKKAAFTVTVSEKPVDPSQSGISLNGVPVKDWETAIKAIGKQYDTFTITVTKPITVSKFTFPKNAGLVVTAANGGSISTTAASLAPKAGLTLNCPITNSKGKDIAINAKSDLTLTGGTFGNVTVGGKAQLSDVTIKGNLALKAKADASGATTDTLRNVTIAKKFTSNNNVIFENCASIGTVTVKGGVKITGTGTWAAAITASGKNAVSVLENVTVGNSLNITGQAKLTDCTAEGKISVKDVLTVNGVVVCRKAVSCAQLNSDEGVNFTFMSLAVTKSGIKNNSADIIVKVIDKNNAAVKFKAGDKKAVVVKSFKVQKGTTPDISRLKLDPACGTGTLRFEKNKIVLV